MMTPSEIYTLLGMQNPDAFSEDRFKAATDSCCSLNEAIPVKERPDWVRRRSGRSTRTYVEIISYISSHPGDKVYFMSPTAQMAKCHINNMDYLINKLNVAAGKGLTSKNIIPCYKKDQVAKIDPSKVFYDHYFFEYLNV